MSSFSQVEPSIDAAIQDFLEKDEIVTWRGKPDAKTHMINALPIFLCGIPWTGFSVFRLFIVEEFKLPDFSATYDYFPLFGFPFLFIGITMLLAPYWYYLQASKLIYVITNQRAFAISLGKKNKFIKYPTENIGNIEKIENRAGAANCGDLFFSNVTNTTTNNPAAELTPKKIGFKGISKLNEAANALALLKEN